METSPRPKKRPKRETSLRPKIRPSEEEIANKRIGRIIKRSNEIKKLIDEESEGLLDRTPLVPISPPTSKPVRGFPPTRSRSFSRIPPEKEGRVPPRSVSRIPPEKGGRVPPRRGPKKRPFLREFAPGGDVRHNPNRGKTY